MKRYPFLILFVSLLLTLISTLLISVSVLETSIARRLKDSDHETAHAIAISLNREALSVREASFLVDAHFALGTYRFIRLMSAQGDLLYSREQHTPENQKQPSRLFWLWEIRTPEQVAAAEVKVRNQDSPIGTVMVKSEPRFDNTLSNRWLLLVLSANLMVLTIFGFVFRFFLSREQRSLLELESIIARLAKGQPFQTAVQPDESVRRIYEKLNQFSDELNFKIAKALLQVEALNRQQRFDEITGLLNRNAFLKKLEETLQCHSLDEEGEIDLIRITNLVELNEKYGRTLVDNRLKRFASALNQSLENQYEAQLGRVSGSDFGIFAPGLALDQQHLLRFVKAQSEQNEFRFSHARKSFSKGNKALQVLGDCERNLRATFLEVAAPWPSHEHEAQLARWKKLLLQGLTEHRFFLQSYKVINAERQLLHNECFIRLLDSDSNAPAITASRLLPWAYELGLAGQIDLEVLALALGRVADRPEAVCINLSELGLIDEQLRLNMLEMLSDAPRYCKMLWLDVPEKFAFEHPQALKQWIDALHPLGVKVGIEHLDAYAGRLIEIQDTGLDYIKVAASLVQALKSPTQQQAIKNLLTHLIASAHQLTLTVIAEGVEQADDLEWIFALDFDGATGPGVG
jgi:EAL domain-containing protein (putative c-di-GMP-specific phosphodiesterase class I)/GGDEF domain-containing protein